MAITSRVYPQLLVFGTVSNWRDQSWDGERTGTKVTVSTVGGPLDVKYRPEMDGRRPRPGENCVVWASVFDGANGSSLTYERDFDAEDAQQLTAAANGGVVE